jgi:hypothetical protein
LTASSQSGGSRPAADRDAWLALDDAALLAGCRVDTYRSSGPGGQHRNKVSSAVRLVHEASGVTAHGDDSRSQHENKRLALKRLRMNLALQLRKPILPGAPLPDRLRDALFVPKPRRLSGKSGPMRLEIGRKDQRFWPAAAVALDVLAACEGRLSDAAGAIGITTSNLASFLKTDRHLLAAAQEVRRAHGRKPIT